MAIGDTIRKLRSAKNLSKQYVADSLNVDRRTYAAWENGEQSIKSNYIPQLAKFFGVEIGDLYKVRNEYKYQTVVQGKYGIGKHSNLDFNRQRSN